MVNVGDLDGHATQFWADYAAALQKQNIRRCNRSAIVAFLNSVDDKDKTAIGQMQGASVPQGLDLRREWADCRRQAVADQYKIGRSLSLGDSIPLGPQL